MPYAGLGAAVLVAVGLLCLGIVISVFMKVREGKPRLDTEKGRKAFLARDYRKLSLIRVRSTQIYKNQYYSVSESEVPLDEAPRPPVSSVETHDYLKIKVEGKDGKTRIVHAAEYGEDALAKLTALVSAWKSAHPGKE